MMLLLVQVVLKYYGLPSLSLRDAVFDELVQDPALVHELWPPKFNLHPTCIGTRYGPLLCILLRGGSGLLHGDTWSKSTKLNICKQSHLIV